LNPGNKGNTVSDEARIAKEIQTKISIPIEEHPFWNKIDSEPQYREEIIQYVLSKFEKAVHTHKKYVHKFTDLKVAE
jgi:hypothetical protein